MYNGTFLRCNNINRYTRDARQGRRKDIVGLRAEWSEGLGQKSFISRRIRPVAQRYTYVRIDWWIIRLSTCTHQSITAVSGFIHCGMERRIGEWDVDGQWSAELDDALLLNRVVVVFSFFHNVACTRLKSWRAMNSEEYMKKNRSYHWYVYPEIFYLFIYYYETGEVRIWIK